MKEKETENLEKIEETKQLGDKLSVLAQVAQIKSWLIALDWMP